MIVVKMLGGLGNQMFQVAYAKSLALEYGEDLYLDVSVYRRYRIREFSLLNLNLSKSILYADDTRLSKTEIFLLKSSQNAYHIYQKILKEITKNDKFGGGVFKLLSKIGLYYNFDRYYYETSISKSKLKCIYGYFQSEKYFEKYKNEITAEMQVTTPLTSRERVILDEINSCNAIAISIRIGDDYEKSSSLKVCTESFYYNAMDFLYESNRDAVFYIFSDNIERVKHRFNFKYPVRYIEGFKDYESLRLMYTCKHFVISNSSFSWWGAYLSNNINKKIIAPNKWYNNSSETPDIYLEEMILMGV